MEVTVSLLLLLIIPAAGNKQYHLVEERSPACEAVVESQSKPRLLLNLHLPEFSLRNDGSPRFSTGKVEDGNEFFWNPCHGFYLHTEGMWCNGTNIARARTESNKRICESIGGAGSFQEDDSGIFIAYPLSAGGRSTIRLHCDPKQPLGKLTCTADCDNAWTNMKFNFNSSRLCLDDLKAVAPKYKPARFSPGSVILISVGSVVAVYMLIGVIHGSVRGAKGFDRMPNSEFWHELPHLVRDGLVFALRGCRVRRPKGLYEPILEKHVEPADV